MEIILNGIKRKIAEQPSEASLRREAKAKDLEREQARAEAFAKYDPDNELLLILLGAKPVSTLSQSFMDCFMLAVSRQRKTKKVRSQDRQDILSNASLHLAKQLMNSKQLDFLAKSNVKFLGLVNMCVQLAYADYCETLGKEKDYPECHDRSEGFYFPDSLNVEVAAESEDCLLDIACARLYNDARHNTNGLTEELSIFLPESETLSDFATRVDKSEDHLRERAREGTLAAEKHGGKWVVKTEQALIDLGVI